MTADPGPPVLSAQPESSSDVRDLLAGESEGSPDDAAVDDETSVPEVVEDCHADTGGACVDHFEGRCPATWCRHHLDSKDRPTMRDRPLRRDPDAPTCSILIASEKPHTLEEVAVLLGLTRERVRQVEVGALVKMGRALIRNQIVGRQVIVGRRGESGVAGLDEEVSGG